MLPNNPDLGEAARLLKPVHLPAVTSQTVQQHHQLHLDALLAVVAEGDGGAGLVRPALHLDRGQQPRPVPVLLHQHSNSHVSGPWLTLFLLGGALEEDYCQTSLGWAYLCNKTRCAALCMLVSCARVVGPGPARQQDSQWGEALHTGPEWPPAALQSQEGSCQVCRQEPPCWQGEGEQWSGRSQPASRLLHKASHVTGRFAIGTTITVTFVDLGGRFL